MSCPVDKYYQTEVTPGRCGSCATYYEICGQTILGADQPGCCPNGYYYSGNTTDCNSCTFGLFNMVMGKKFKCLPYQPSMDDTRRLNCCLDQNLPNNNPEGYCASGWCPGSDRCISFLTNYCRGDNLQKRECIFFCKNNPGRCDYALKEYCKNPNNFTKEICGCALPLDQYPLSKFKTPEGESIPIACDQRCGVKTDAIRLQGQQDCKINAICVVDINDFKIYDSYVQKGIEIRQDCGEHSKKEDHVPSPSDKSTSSPADESISSPADKSVLPPSLIRIFGGKVTIIIIIVILILTIIAIILMIWR
ncbi:MAG: hypothetical protein QXW79_00525 [Thermoplasmata archaeon]